MTQQPSLPAVEPKPRRRMRKPLKSALYARVESQEAELERLRIDRDRLVAENDTLRARWWRRALNLIKRMDADRSTTI
jgi:hypothetical protein